VKARAEVLAVALALVLLVGLASRKMLPVLVEGCGSGEVCGCPAPNGPCHMPCVPEGCCSPTCICEGPGPTAAR
jgi:hypothetical protein